VQWSRCIRVAVVLGYMAVAGLARAGVIVELGATYGPTAGPAILDDLTSPDPNNDNTGFSSDFVQYHVTLNSSAPVDIALRVINSGETTEYDLIGDALNRSGGSWIGYRLELGFGLGPDFIPVNLLGLDFDTPDMDSLFESGSFPPIAHAAGTVVWAYADLPTTPNNWGGATFSVDVPDLGPTDTAVPGDARTTDGYWFTIRQTPLVPEPATGLLLGTGVAVLALGRRGRGAGQRFSNQP
jgi:hypothetical protein